MKYPKNELAQLVVASCVANEIEDVIISPGSRNAPLTIGFTSHPKIKTYCIVDERCAAFVAIGIAQQKRKATAVVCTSGSAMLNYYPAVSEAYYSDIPLIIISADRPEYLIDIGDGQTIRQKNVFKNHSLYNANLNNMSEHKSCVNNKNLVLLEKAFEAAIKKLGPVHINVPFEEPLYETVEKLMVLESKKHQNLNSENTLETNFLKKYADLWNKANKKIVLIGANHPNTTLQTQLGKLAKDPSILIFTETTSNITHQKFINNIDQLLFPLEDSEFENLKPNILLTLGGLVVSKKVKQFFRKYKPKNHWHISPKKAYDSYHCLTYHFKILPQTFFSQFLPLTKSAESSFQKKWLKLKSKRKEKHKKYLSNLEFSDLKAHEIIFESIPKNTNLQLSNSSIIRYSQLVNLNTSLRVFCNRGTSGIEGSTSTAIGAAIASKNMTVFITGDISFFYDSNALWNKYIPNNLKIILINNNGGGIFKFIPGPSETDIIDYFETPHGLNASNLCKMHGISYQPVSNEKELKNVLDDFYKEYDKPKLIEIHTPSEINNIVLKEYFENIK